MIKDLMDPRTPYSVETPNGTLRGFKWRNVYHFLGVPYGTAERWQKAEMVKPWKGIRDCMEYGNVIPRFTGHKTMDDIHIPRPFHNMSEDCLNLNIYTRNTDTCANMPVMVYVHGGGFSDGSAHAMYCYDGEANADERNVVMVFVNHRLNIFGFLDCSKYGEQYKNSGNAGLEDLILALKWVKKNIRFFGGNPNNVTIYGQSGGGGKVTTLLQTPEADGLYHKVICMSGLMEHDQISGQIFSNKLIEFMLKKLNTKSFEDLVALDPDSLMDLARNVEPEIKEIGYSLRSWRPCDNGWSRPSAFKAGFTNYGKTVPMIIGSVITEFARDPKIENKDSLSEEERLQIVREVCGDKPETEELIQEWHKVWPDKNLVEAVYPDEFRASVKHYANIRCEECNAPTYIYEFARSFPWDGGNTAWHSSDLPFIFHNIDMYPESILGSGNEDLEKAMSGAWTNFAKTGNPNGEDLPVEWRPYTAQDHATYVFDIKCENRVDFDDKLIELHDKLGIKMKF